MMKVFWFRKDLRLLDNRALYFFVNSVEKYDKYTFIYIKNNNSFKYFGEKRISFLYECLSELKNELHKLGLELNILEGNSRTVFKKLVNNYGTLEVFCNEQIEPYCLKRDLEVKKYFEANSGKLNTFRDTTLMDINKIVKDNSSPYTVFTPFKNKFLKFLSHIDYKECKTDLSKLIPENHITLSAFSKHDVERKYNELGKSNLIKGGRKTGIRLLNDFFSGNIGKYESGRDYPAVHGTSMLSAHLHFGTINIRECFRKIYNKDYLSSGIAKWRDELIWREFYYNIAFNFPHVAYGSFKKEYDGLNWNYDKKIFKLWCEGKTGFPIVDAGMRQLKKDGWMHNRVRMITAMFLTKDLLIDWKLGEKFFAENLIDMDFSSNNGGWQWSASTGCDAQPYFRIFNPYTQSIKYDPEGVYIKRYICELKNVPDKYIHNPSEMSAEEQKKFGVKIGKDYPAPILKHSQAAKYAIETFKNIRKNKFY